MNATGKINLKEATTFYMNICIYESVKISTIIQTSESTFQNLERKSAF